MVGADQCPALEGGVDANNREVCRVSARHTPNCTGGQQSEASLLSRWQVTKNWWDDVSEVEKTVQNWGKCHKCLLGLYCGNATNKWCPKLWNY
jgi:hypothetical protein